MFCLKHRKIQKMSKTIVNTTLPIQVRAFL